MTYRTPTQGPARHPAMEWPWAHRDLRCQCWRKLLRPFEKPKLVAHIQVPVVTPGELVHGLHLLGARDRGTAMRRVNPQLLLCRFTVAFSQARSRPATLVR